MIGHPTLSTEFGGMPYESAFEDEFRFKEVSIDLNVVCKRIDIYWTSQEWGKEPSKVFDEILRCLEYLGVENYSVKLELRDRDFEHEQIFTKRI